MLDTITWEIVWLRLGYAALAIVVAAAAMLGLVLYSHWFDKRNGTTFREALDIMEDEPLALATYYGHRIRGIMTVGASIILMLALLLSCAPAQAGALTSSKYDFQIRQAVHAWWPAYPFPAAWKAQLYQESRLDPAAVSPAGAAGLAQFMPGTWAEISRELRLPPGLSPHHAWAIEAGAYYMAKLRAQWSAPRPAEDRHRLAQASYNAGLGHLLDAQRRCGGPPEYEAIVACLPRVTGRHSAETRSLRRSPMGRMIEAEGKMWVWIVGMS